MLLRYSTNRELDRKNISFKILAQKSVSTRTTQIPLDMLGGWVKRTTQIPLDMLGGWVKQTTQISLDMLGGWVKQKTQNHARGLS